jgi:cell wall-associated NlpC family hydrolase
MRSILSILAPTAFLFLSACGSAPQRHDAPSQSRDRTLVVNTALAQIGKPYHYGGSKPSTGFDCSGLVYYSYKSAGIEVPRTSKLQLRHTRRVNSGWLQPGDLLFYKINNKPSHVGIYIGNGKFVHAPSSGNKVEISHMESNYWRKRLYSTGTFLY